MPSFDDCNPTIRWAHLSDLHMPTSYVNDFNIKDRLPSLIGELEEFKPHFLVFSGDLTQSGKRPQYEKICSRLLKPLIHTNKKLKDRLFFCPGNHDLDWDILSKLAPEVRTSINSQNDMTGFLGESPELPLILTSQNAYRHVLKEYTRLELDGNLPISNTVSFQLKKKKISITLLDTTLLCKAESARGSGRDPDYGCLAIGHSQISRAIENVSNIKADLRIVVTHHPLNYLTPWDQDTVHSLFQNHFDVHLYGHNHKPAFAHAVSNSGTLASIQTGALFTTYHSDSLYTQFIWGSNSKKINVISRHLHNTAKSWKPQGQALELSEPRLKQTQTLSKEVPTVIGEYNIKKTRGFAAHVKGEVIV